MDKARWDKLAAGGGIVGVVLFVVAAILYGNPPGVDEDAQSVAEFFSDNRDQLLWATFLQGLGVLAILWFVSALVHAMREAGEARLAAAAFGGFLLEFAVGGMAAITQAALAYSIADEGSDLVLPFYHLALVFYVFSNLFSAGLLAAVCGATFRTGILPRWWGWLSGLAALLVIIDSTTWARSGFWSPSGGGTAIGFGVFAVWTLVTSILLARRVGREATE